MNSKVVVVGAGISGMTFANAAVQSGISNLIVVDHRTEKGGFTKPYWSIGSEYEEEKAAFAEHVDVTVLYSSTVLGVFISESGEDHVVEVQTPMGSESIKAKAVIFASGALEKPREGNRIPGDRPAGVMTPYMALSLLDKGMRVGTNILLYDSGRHARTLATHLRKLNLQVQVVQANEVEVLHIIGKSRVEAVEVKNVASQVVERIPCDTFIYSDGRQPATFYLKHSPVERNHQDEIVVNALGQTNIERIYAIGSCTNFGDDEHLQSLPMTQKLMHSIIEEIRGIE